MKLFKLLPIFMSLLASGAHAAQSFAQADMASIVDGTVRPLMQKYQIPGMSIALTVRGKRYFYDYGVASNETRQPVTNRTLFEVGSFSKTFAAALASYAQSEGRLSWSDSASQYLPSLRGSSFDHISLLNLATHTSGLPLFVPDALHSTDQLMGYLAHWTPPYAIGTHRIYSNIGAGLLGMIAAKRLQGSYDDLLGKIILAPLGMTHSYIDVPASRMKDYAQGYTTKNMPIRLKAGVLSAEAYGLKSCSLDLIEYVEANMGTRKVDAVLQRALIDTHTAYFTAGDLTQDLIWEQYPYPVGLKQLLAGNGAIYQAAVATRITPLAQPQANVLINKTGSTNGFATYVAFVPAAKIGIVLLANKSYPVDQRVIAAHRILSQLQSALAAEH